MTWWSVDPGRVRSGGRGLSTVGSDVDAMAASVGASLTAIARAGGDSGVAQGGELAARRWRLALHRIGEGAGGLGAAVVAAAAGYEAADSAVAEAFGGGR